LPRTVNAILLNMSAPTKILQTRALTALDAFTDESEEEELLPFLGAILAKMSECYNAYQLKNLYQLFETADTVYQCFGRHLAADEHITPMMQPLMGMWGGIANDSPLIFPFFMAMASACSALGAAVEPMAGQIFERAFGMVQFHTQARVAAVTASEEEPEHSQEFLVAGLDLLSGLCQAMGSTISNYVQQAGSETFATLLAAVGSDTSPEIRQSAFSVLGELCGGCIGFVQAYWGTVAPLIANALEDTVNYTAASNAAWALGDFLSNYTEDGSNVLQTAHIDAFYVRLANMLTVEHDSDMRLMRENAAIGIARILSYDPAVVSRAGTADYHGEFCAVIAPMKNGAQKEAAIRGLVAYWNSNPALLGPHAANYLDVLAGLPQNVPQDLRGELQQLSNALKQGLGPQWAAAVQSKSGQIRTKLQRNFSITA
jgi:transportin-2